MGNLVTPNKVQKLQNALHAKAKAEGGYRFYALYDKLYREDILAHAYALCRANKGAPGVDEQDFAAVELYGEERWLSELAQSLRDESYQPEVIRRVWIAKANGGHRPLGISTLKDRVCMRAAALVLGPIFEVDLPPQLYAYRPGRSAQQAIVDAQEGMYRGRPDVVDADLSDYFGSIPHGDLMQSLARRIVDRRVLALLKRWLECPVEEQDRRGRRRRTIQAKDEGCGISQGSPLSPLFANVYMRRFVLAWLRAGLDRQLGSQLVIYADDLVILCRRGCAEQALSSLRQIMNKLKLTINEEKTRLCRIPHERFEFLGYTFGRMYSPKTGQARLGMRPSTKSVKKMKRKLHDMTRLALTWQDSTTQVEKVNRVLRGWANYFSIGTRYGEYKSIDQYTAMRMRRWLRSKHTVRRRKGGGDFPPQLLYEQYGLVRLTEFKRSQL